MFNIVLTRELLDQVRLDSRTPNGHSYSLHPSLCNSLTQCVVSDFFVGCMGGNNASCIYNRSMK